MIIDSAFNSLMVAIENTPMTKIASFLGFVFDPQVIIILTILIGLFIFIKVSRKKAFFFCGTVAFTAGSIYILKHLLDRARPINMLISETGGAFPSGHASMILIFLFSLVYFFSHKDNLKRNYIIAGIISFIIGLSRLYLRVHWLTDVLGGFLIAAGLFVIETILDKKWSLKYGSKKVD